MKDSRKSQTLLVDRKSIDPWAMGNIWTCLDGAGLSKNEENGLRHVVKSDKLGLKFYK